MSLMSFPRSTLSPFTPPFTHTGISEALSALAATVAAADVPSNVSAFDAAHVPPNVSVEAQVSKCELNMKCHHFVLFLEF